MSEVSRNPAYTARSRANPRSAFVDLRAGRQHGEGEALATACSAATRPPGSGALPAIAGRRPSYLRRRFVDIRQEAPAGSDWAGCLPQPDLSGMTQPVRTCRV